jgi:hypothetical protein
MSEAWVESLESEGWDTAGEGSFDGEFAGEGAYDSEAVGDSYDSEATGEASYGEESRSERHRRERQRRIMLERQRQAQLRRQRRPAAPRRGAPPQRVPRTAGPSPRQTITAVRSLDLETKVAHDSLRRALEESNRRATRATYAALASVAVDQGLDSFGTDLDNHPYVRAGARFAPLLLLSPEKKKGGFEGFVADPRLWGFVAISGIAVIGKFRSAGQGVHTINIFNPGPITLGAPADAPVTGTLTAVVLDKSGNVLPPAQYPITWASQSPDNALTVNNASTGAYTAGAPGTALVTAQAGGITSAVFVVVNPFPAV